MLFSSDKESDSSQEGKEKKKDSLFGLLFNPNRGTEVQPVLDSLRMFPRMVALVFAVAGLFPKDHPALTDEKLRLSWRSVIGTAWGNVRFTREGLPGALTFAAVVSMLAMVVTFLVSLVLSLFMGTAHAAEAPSGSIFKSPASSDWGDSLIDFLFFGKGITQVGGSGTTDCGFISALSDTLGFFSSAVLVFAGIMLLYHLVSMIAKTAQSGKPFEGANQVWGPIRLVFAIALLVPISSTPTSVSDSCPVSGYNAGQYLVLKIAKWGSALGSNGWEFFLNSLSGTSAITCPSGAALDAETTSSPSCVNSERNVSSFVSALVAYDACARYADHYLDEQGIEGYETVRLLGQIAASGKESYLGYRATKEGEKWWHFDDDTNRLRFCGGFSLPEKPDSSENPYSTVYDAYKNALQELFIEVTSFNNTYWKVGVEGVRSDKDSDEMYGAYKTLVEKYQQILGARIDKAVSEGNKEADKRVKEGNGATAKEYGWVYAAAWFNTIVKMQVLKFQSVDGGKPLLISPAFEPEKKESKLFQGVAKSVQDATLKYSAILARFKGALDEEANTSDTSTKVLKTAGDTSTFSGESAKELLTSASPMDALADMAIAKGTEIGLWSFSGELGVKFDFIANPIEQVAAYGRKLIELAASLLGVAGILGFVGGLTITVPFVKLDPAPLAQLLAGFLSTLSTLFFTAGFTLTYVVVLYPFYRFFFGTMKWLVSVFEAVVMVPLFALAHIHPGGDGLAGPQGKYGYSMAMQILLRPVLMVLGLIAGFLIFKATLVLLNEIFVVVTKGSGGMDGFIVGMIGFVAYTIIYVFFVVMLANQCFKTIGVFPQVALSWLGMQGVQEEKFDTGMLTTAAAYVSKEVAGQISGQVSGAGKSLSAGRKAVKDEAEAGRKNRENLAIQGITTDKKGRAINPATGLPYAP